MTPRGSQPAKSAVGRCSMGWVRLFAISFQEPGPIGGGRFAGTGGALAFSHPNLVFPHSNVTLLSWLTLGDFGVPGGGNGNSCFGYTSPSGREYAIIGLSTGTAFVASQVQTFQAPVKASGAKL